jgi:hypothetical protein
VLLALTTAQLGLVTTAVVGVAAALSPVGTAWATRNHERAIARSARLFDQPRDLYVELAAFLERDRMSIARTEPILTIGGEPLKPPPEVTDEDWIKMRARWVALASGHVHAGMLEASKRRNDFVGAVMVYKGTPRGHANWADARKQMDEARDAADAAFDDVEHTMSAELVRL